MQPLGSVILIKIQHKKKKLADNYTTLILELLNTKHSLD